MHTGSRDHVRSYGTMRREIGVVEETDDGSVASPTTAPPTGRMTERAVGTPLLRMRGEIYIHTS